MVHEDQTTYAVDLSREEYVRSQELASRRARGARWISPVLLFVCVLMTISNTLQSGVWDPSVFSLLIILVTAEVWMMLSLPKQVRRRHEAAYNTTVFRGYDFAGTITVESDAIRKQTRTATALIPFSTCRLFVEVPDMMVFFGADGKGIVIPARFLTEETANATRQAAVNAISPQNRMMIAPVVPTGTGSTPLAEPPKKDDTLLTVDIMYTDREMVSIATEAALQQFWETLPNKFLTMTMVTTIGFFMLYIRPLPLFLAGMVLLFLISVLTAFINIRRAIAHSERRICSVRLEFTDRELLLISKNGGAEPLHFPWELLTRAVDCGDHVELYVDNVQQVMIPKRCVEDFEELSRIVDSHM